MQADTNTPSPGVDTHLQVAHERRLRGQHGGVLGGQLLPHPVDLRGIRKHH